MEENVIAALSGGGLVVLKTDTLYGILGSIANEQTIERVYQAKERSPEKPLIVLAGSVDDVYAVSNIKDRRVRSFLEKVWPGPVSVLLPVSADTYPYIHRGTEHIAFRVPADSVLRRILAATGPVVAPSANIEGAPPVRSITEAKEVFGGAVDVYVDGGVVLGDEPPSTLVSFDTKGEMHCLREGATPCASLESIWLSI